MPTIQIGTWPKAEESNLGPKAELNSFDLWNIFLKCEIDFIT